MKLSIIIPTVGRETLGPVLEALHACQDFDVIDPEIIVVFDGPNHVALNSHDDDLLVFETGKKVGVSGVRNFGIQKARGEVIVFLQDDTIPDPDWLRKVHAWHEAHPEPRLALLGRVHWTEALAKDRFHQWLDRGVQFDFPSLEKGKKPDWRHFYTANISLKKEFLGDDLFDENFTGWGFEDAELGYRLSKRGLKINFDEEIKVYHDHEQSLTGLVSRTKSASANAAYFESLYPELTIRPTGFKRQFLEFFIWITKPLDSRPEWHWWRHWKAAWLGH